uniref:FH2 domain-containing protein n=1 Tax=Steinernema glaseri TaxID=37863 RepID=A0A1I8ABB4_9BILA
MTSLAQPPSTTPFGSAEDADSSPASPKSEDLAATSSAPALFPSPPATTTAPSAPGPLGSIFHSPNPDPYQLFQLLAQHVQHTTKQEPKLMQTADLYSLLTNQSLLQNQMLLQQQQQQSQLAAAAHQQQVQAQQQQDRKRTYPYTFQYCVLCQKNVHSSKLPCHIRQCHVAKPMFQCPACDFTSTYSKNNVKSHMVSLHGLAGDPISYMDQYAGQVEEFMKKCFPNVRGRGRPMHGGKRASPKLPQSPAAPPAATPAAPNTVASQLQRKRAETNNNLLLAMNSQALQRNVAQNAAQNAARKTPAAFAELYASALKLAPQQVTLPGLLNPFGETVVGATAAVREGEALKQDLWDNGAADSETGLLSSNASSNDDYKSQSHNEQLCYTTLASNYSRARERRCERVQTNRESLSPSAEGHQSLSQVVELSSQLGGIGQSWRGPDSDSSGSQSGYAVQPGENMQPRYLAHQLAWSVLNAEQLPNTVFDTFVDVSGVVDKVDMSKFEPLADSSSALLTPEQLERIGAVRQKIDKEPFEILYAVAKLQTGDLSAENVADLETIAPSAVDIQRFKSFAEINNVSSLSDDEKFIFDLTKIERFEEKLFVLSYTTSFAVRAQEAQLLLADFSQAAKLLHRSMAFSSVLQLALICGNFVCGYFNAQIVRGFRTSTINELCEFKISEQETLLDVLATSLHKEALSLDDFLSHLDLFEKVGEAEFARVLADIKQLENGQLRAMAEVHASSSSGHSALIETLTNASQQITQLNDAVHQCKVSAPRRSGGLEPLGEQCLRAKRSYRGVLRIGHRDKTVKN